MITLDIATLLKQASVHFSFGIFIGFCIAWILISKVKRENHAELLKIIKQKDEIIKQKENDITRKNNECDRQADIFSKVIVTKDTIITALNAKLESYKNSQNDTQSRAKHTN